jgi:transposase-like protein
MDIHKNARTTRHSRMLMVQRLASGWTPTAVAQAQGVTARTVRKWRDRFAATGEAGLADRSSRPHRSPTRLGAPAEEAIEALRRQRMTGPAIARRLGRPLSTIGVVLRRRGLGRLRVLEPRPPILRYERERPGELLHIDIKKLGASTELAIASPASAQARAPGAQSGVAWAGSLSMSRSTMPAGSPTPSSCLTSASKAPSPSPAARWRGLPATASASSAS